MIVTRSVEDQSWTDLSSPTKEEVDSLVLTQNISPVIAKDILTPTPIQSAEDGNAMLYIVLHIPAFKHSHQVSESDAQEIDFIITAQGIITARYDSIDSLHYFAKRIEMENILNKGEDCHIFFAMMKEIYKSMTDELLFIEDWMQEIEKNIFHGKERDMVFAISEAGRNLLNFKRTIDPHGSIFEFMRDVGGEKFGKEFEDGAKTLLNEWRHMIKRVVNQIEMLNELRETNNSLLSTKQNEIMKQLAVIGLIILPLTFIGQLFGMSVRFLPLIDHPYAFWVVLALMAAVMLLSLAFAKLKKWM